MKLTIIFLKFCFHLSVSQFWWVSLALISTERGGVCARARACMYVYVCVCVCVCFMPESTRSITGSGSVLTT